MTDQNGKPKNDSFGGFEGDGNTGSASSMPSVTKLLNRKSLGLSTGSIDTPISTPEPQATRSGLRRARGSSLKKPKGSALVETPQAVTPPTSDGPTEAMSSPKSAQAGLEIQLSTGSDAVFERSAAPAQQQTRTDVKVETRTATRRKSTPAPELIEWQMTLLKTGQDPLGKGLATLLEQGALAALFLAIQPLKPGQSAPLFQSTACAGAFTDRKALWSGFHWNPALAPELWNGFLQQGWIEFSPPGTQTHVQSHRNVIRGALGCVPGEWLTLIRVGSPQGCRGALAVISQGPLGTALTAALKHLHQGPKKAAA